MDNLLIMDDVDICFIEQNSWIVLLDKQIVRNFYLLKLHEIDRCGKKFKICQKDLYGKIKNSINKSIKLKIRNRKNSGKMPSLNESTSNSLSLRRKTEEGPQKRAFKLICRTNSNSPKADHFVSSESIGLREKSRYENNQFTNHYTFLPFSSVQVKIEKDTNLLKQNSRKVFQTKSKLPKPLSQAKPILSLHELEFNKKEQPSSQKITCHKRLTHIEKLLIRSSMNSPKKGLELETDGYELKKSYEHLPEIGKLDGKKICMSEFMTKLCGMREDWRDQSVHDIKKTQETKGSQSDNVYGLQSIIEYCMNSKNKGKEGFEDYHIGKGTLMKSYRISKIRNINFPVT